MFIIFLSFIYMNSSRLFCKYILDLIGCLNLFKIFVISKGLIVLLSCYFSKTKLLNVIRYFFRKTRIFNMIYHIEECFLFTTSNDIYGMIFASATFPSLFTSVWWFTIFRTILYKKLIIVATIFIGGGIIFF